MNPLRSFPGIISLSLRKCFVSFLFSVSSGTLAVHILVCLTVFHISHGLLILFTSDGIIANMFLLLLGISVD